MNKETLIEIAFLVLLFGGLLYIGPGEVFQHQLKHDKPVQFGAVDGFFHAMFTQHVYDEGNWRYLPSYATEFPDALAYNPPLFMHVAAAFAHTSGISAYDSLALLMGIFGLLVAFIMYWLIRDFNKKVAFLSVPLFVFLYVMNFLIGYIWGEALLYAGSFFLISLFFLMNNPELKFWWAIGGIFIAASIMSHTSETIFFYGFIAFFIGIKALLRKLSLKEVLFWTKQITYATLLGVMLSFNYILIFYHGLYKFLSPGYKALTFVRPEEFTQIRAPFLQQFSTPIAIIIIVGVMLAIVLSRKHHHISLFGSSYMFLVGLTNYVGLGYRAVQTRFLWPIYLAVFFGTTLYFLLKFIKSNIKLCAISIALVVFFVYKFYTPIHPDMIYNEQWQAFKWIEENTPSNARILFFYGDGYSQSSTLLRRAKFEVDINEYSKLLSNENVKSININPRMENAVGYLYRKGFLNFGYHSIEQNLKNIRPMDVCSFDFYVADKRSAYAPQVAQANIAIFNNFLNHGMSMVYQNDHTIILQNYDIGGDCVA